MPAPIYIEDKNVWTEAFKNLLPVVMNFFMTKEYLSKGISENEYKELKKKLPNIEQIFEKKGDKYVVKENINPENIQDSQIKDLLLEYYKKENIKQKYKTNPFTYLGGLQNIIANPVVMSYLSDLSSTLEEKQRKKKKEDTEKYIQTSIFPQLLNALGVPQHVINLDTESFGQILPLLFMLKIFQNQSGSK